MAPHNFIIDFLDALVYRVVVRSLEMVHASKTRFAMYPLPCASTLLPKGRRRGWLNVQSGIAVNSDQGLNQTIGKPWMLDAETLGVSGGTKAGLKPSLAR
jgi:hypothetical protein